MGKHKFTFGSHVGTSSILLVFVILCLVSFASLSIVSANADNILTTKIADKTTAYYNASNIAQHKIAETDAQLTAAYGQASDSAEYFALVGESTTFDIPITDTQYLNVVLLHNYPEEIGQCYYTIQSYKVITHTDDLHYDESLHVLQRDDMN